MNAEIVEQLEQRALEFIQNVMKDRLLDPSAVPMEAVKQAARLINTFMLNHIRTKSKEYNEGFVNGVIVSLIVYHTTPDNVRDLYEH